MKNTFIAVAVVGLVIGAGSFYGGMHYAKANAGSQRANIGGAFRGGANAGGMGARNGAGFVNGEILSKDDKSITLKLRDGGSKIILYSATTEIGKFTSGTSADLEIGKTISVTGQTNSDGSVSAQSLQIRPPMPSMNPSASK